MQVSAVFYCTNGFHLFWRAVQERLSGLPVYLFRSVNFCTRLPPFDRGFRLCKLKKRAIMANTKVQICTTSPDSANTPILQVIDGKVMATSLRVAEHFKKRHSNVLTAIRLLSAQLPRDSNGLFFEPVNYTDAKGESRVSYRMTRDGFTLLAMGFTGSTAFNFKLAYITAFNSMESALQAKTKPEWAQARLQGKTARKSLTDAVQNFVEYAKSQGSQNAERYYANITKMEYAALELTEKGQKIPKEFRDTLNTMDIGFLLAAEQVCKRVLDDGVKRGLPYKDIYALAKDRVIAYAKVIAMPRLA